MRIGYARVSTGEQKLDLQLDALDAADCKKTYTDTISGATSSRPELDTCLEHLREGDTLVVWRLDRFGRSLKDLVAKIEALDERGVEFVSLTEGIDTTTAQVGWRSTFSVPLPSSSGRSPGSGRWPDSGLHESAEELADGRERSPKKIYLKSRRS
jgi:hypothetical protein